MNNTTQTDTMTVIGAYFERDKAQLARISIDAGLVIKDKVNRIVHPDLSLGGIKAVFGARQDYQEIELLDREHGYSSSLVNVRDWILDGPKPDFVCLAAFGPLPAYRGYESTPLLPPRINEYPLSAPPLKIFENFHASLKKIGIKHSITKDTFALAAYEFFNRRLQQIEPHGVLPQDLICYVNVGHGIGIGYCCEGSPWEPRTFPEVGHMHIRKSDFENIASVCKAHTSCLAGFATVRAINKRLGKYSDARPETAFQALPPNLPDDIIQVEAHYLAQLCASINQLIAPDLIILGGPVADIPGIVEATRQQYLDQLHIASSFDPHPRLPRTNYIRGASNDHDGRAGVWGALLLGARHLGPRLR
ncbi:ROK family protein [Rhizobium sp. RU36D]|uniref:ROK family protein n=1 Tax=Rhizobium sp. RU36D TaxID=1907415 RepID=UPI0009D8A38D|nr:ROK family protein [Rhizobium sp. RU36D]SMC78085.1 Sugar kinase of the NBD/HSP70 family, may contain an N-terminal HTH domain [Rhizobium sp. RU36D]